MARKTNCVINGKEYYRIVRKVGMRPGKYGIWVDDRKAFYGSCKKEAEEKYREYMEHNKNGQSADVCLGELIDDWVENVFKGCELADSTKALYLSAYNRVLRPSHIAGIKAADVTPMDLQKLYNTSDTSYGTKKALHNFLVRFYKYAELNGLCRNITTCLTVPGKPKNKDNFSGVTVWDDDSLKRLIKALKNDRLRMLVVLAVNTGARFSELIALSYDDIHGNMLYINKQMSEIASMDGGEAIPHIIPTKTANSNRIIPLSEPVLKEIERHREWQQKDMEENGYQTNYLFTTKNGTFYYKRNVRRSILRTCKRAGIDPQTFHSFRHTFGTNLSRTGVQIEDTSKLLGHADITTTSRYYVNVDAQKKLEAVEGIAKFSLGD